MINVYTNKKVKDLTYIHDVEAHFNVFWKEIITSKFAKRVMKNIDNVSEFYDDHVLTPFGIARYTELSTGCKALLIAIYRQDCLVNFLETGENVLEELILLNKKDASLKINIYTPKSLLTSHFDEELYLNGKLVTWFDLIEI